MGMEIALIPAAMFIMGIGMMIYMKKKRGSLAPGYAQQEMKRFVKEMVPQLSEEEFHVIDCPWNAEHHFVIAYTDESIFFIPALPNPMTMKIMKYSGERGAGLGSLVSHTILGSDSADGVEMVPASAVSGVEIDEGARRVRIAVRDEVKKYQFKEKDCFGGDHEEALGISDRLVGLELVRRHEAHDGVVLAGRLEVLADGQEVHVGGAQVVHELEHFVALLAEAHHDTRLGEHGRVQFLHALPLGGGGPVAHTAINLLALDPAQQGLWHAANLWGNRFNSCPQGGVVGSVLLHHTHSAFAHFRGELR